MEPQNTPNTQMDIGEDVANLLSSRIIGCSAVLHLAQCLNYLKATGLHLCLLFNFCKPRLEIKRIVLGLQCQFPCHGGWAIATGLDPVVGPAIRV